jgi:hypothetical protein
MKIDPVNIINGAMRGAQKQSDKEAKAGSHMPSLNSRSLHASGTRNNPTKLTSGDSNIYDVPLEESEGIAPHGTNDESSQPPKKRGRPSRTSARAKAPSSANESKPRSSRRLRSNQNTKISTKELTPSNSMHVAQVPETDPKFPQAKDPIGNDHPRAKVGRPRKRKSQPASSNNPAGVEDTIDARDVAEAEDAPGTTIELQKVSNSREQLPQRTYASDSSEEDSNSNAAHHAQDPDGTMEGDLADLEIFNRMKATLKHGHSEVKDDFVTQQGSNLKSEQDVQALKDELTTLKTLYRGLRKSRASGTGTKKVQKDVTNSIKKITSRTAGLQLRAQPILTDVYLDIMPAFVNAITVGVDAHTHPVNEPISTAAVGEIQNFLGLMCELAEKAANKPDKVQPKTVNGVFLRRSTKNILPMIRDVHEKFLTEFNTRMKAQSAAEREEISAYLAKRNENIMNRKIEREQKSAEESAKLKNKREETRVHKIQRRDFDAKLADPLLAQWVRRETAQDETRLGNPTTEMMNRTQHLEVTQFTRPLANLDYEELVQNDLRASNDREQVKRSNQHEDHRPVRWSNDAKIIFIDIMRDERGNITPFDCYNRSGANITRH